MKFRNRPEICLYVLLHLLLMVSCKRSELGAEALENYILEEKNGLIQSSEENKISVQAVFRPSSLIAFQEIKSLGNVSEKIVLEIQNRYSCNVYILVNIRQAQQDPLYRMDDPSQYSETVKQLAFRMSEKAYLLTSKTDTIRAADFVFPHMYGISGAVSVMFAFPMKGYEEYEWIDFELSDPGMKIGNRTFRFMRKDIDNIPDLNYKSE